ncbi:MAG TPA: hypothetical protein VEA60_10070 [Allosphingosinicella sp.]|nr:hypothetical protein [Allosphingosinicella sp.]
MSPSDDAGAAWSALPSPPDPVGLYVPFVRFGDFVSAISTARGGVLALRPAG